MSETQSEVAPKNPTPAEPRLGAKKHKQKRSGRKHPGKSYKKRFTVYHLRLLKSQRKAGEKLRIKKPATDIFEDIVIDILARYRTALADFELVSGRKAATYHDVVCATRLIFNREPQLLEMADVAGKRAVKNYVDYRGQQKVDKK